VTGLPGLAEAILKIHWFDLGEAMRADPDPRFGTMWRALPVPPHFSATRDRLERARRALPVAVPEVLAEGRLPRGVGYTLMSRVDGMPWGQDGGPPPRALSLQAGSIVGALHAGTAQVPAAASHDLASAPRSHAEIASAIADYVPEFAARGEGGRPRLRERLAALVERAVAAPLGGPVLAHGDFNPSNLLVGYRGRIVGVVDFNLSCFGPRALDFRALDTFDRRAFLEGSGAQRQDEELMHWLGLFYDLLWLGLAMVTTARFTDATPGAEYWITYATTFEYTMRVLEDDAMRMGPPGARLRTRAEIEAGVRREAVGGYQRAAAREP
jgi:hypothetical protein